MYPSNVNTHQTTSLSIIHKYYDLPAYSCYDSYTVGILPTSLVPTDISSLYCTPNIFTNHWCISNSNYCIPFHFLAVLSSLYSISFPSMLYFHQDLPCLADWSSRPNAQSCFFLQCYMWLAFNCIVKTPLPSCTVSPGYPCIIDVQNGIVNCNGESHLAGSSSSVRQRSSRDCKQGG